ncbi:MAG TPA: hypothetical protein VHM19_11410 [Polyangiales bacterium]|jgi:hypothetical protein|nr:hypothetical protein [Polyangiales bacterium]
MRLHRLVLACAFACFAAGCGSLQQASPGAKFGNTVHDMNDQARWGRLGDASQYVESSYRTKYLQNHRMWGSKIQLADVEVVQVQMSPDGESANAFVTYSWYGTDAMTLHQSVVRQRWIATRDSYAMFSEAVVQGDAALLGGQGITNPDNAAVSALGD